MGGRYRSQDWPILSGLDYGVDCEHVCVKPFLQSPWFDQSEKRQRCSFCYPNDGQNSCQQMRFISKYANRIRVSLAVSVVGISRCLQRSKSSAAQVQQQLSFCARCGGTRHDVVSFGVCRWQLDCSLLLLSLSLSLSLLCV